jgi:hypothetical protein
VAVVAAAARAPVAVGVAPEVRVRPVRVRPVLVPLAPVRQARARRVPVAPVRQARVPVHLLLALRRAGALDAAAVLVAVVRPSNRAATAS